MKSLRKQVVLTLLIVFLFLISLVSVFAVNKAINSNIYVDGNSVGIEIIYPEPVFCSVSSLTKQGSSVNILQNKCQPLPTLNCGMTGKNSFNFSQSFVSEGIYAFKLVVQDCVGNQRTDNYTINVSFTKLAGCGDGIKLGLEECDDKNLKSGDGCSSSCKLESCGNGRIDTNEICDGVLLQSRSCLNFTSPNGLKYTGGKLFCSSTCGSFVTSNCTYSSNPLCGNGVLDAGEKCDLSKSGLLLSGVKTCNALNSNYTSGALGCTNSCGFDLSKCVGNSDSGSVCGNGELETGEECDGSELKSCTNLGFLSGTTTCNKCKINTTKCVPTNKVNGTCGDAFLSAGESCDYNGTKILFPKNSSCSVYSASFSSGVLTCDKKSCSINTSSCTTKTTSSCGNLRFDFGEECDGSAKLTCKNLGFTGGLSKCSADCTYDTKECTGNRTGVVTPNAICGNRVIESGEQCDGLSWGKYSTCTSFDSKFKSGDLSCDPKTCIFITKNCTGYVGGTCGDGQLAVGEQCDGALAKSCTDFGNFIGGSLVCLANSCNYDTSLCRKPNPVCGDGEFNFGEECDGKMFDGDLSTCDNLESFSSGDLACTDDCKVDSSSCDVGTEIDPKCIDKIKDPFESDIDCGGSCLCCDTSKKCGVNSDCCSGFCGSNGVCAQAKCDDGIKNGLESGVDCGGSCDAKCQNGAPCSISNDCQSNFCLEGSCVIPSCSDSYQNGLESDVDCGGSCESKCLSNQKCESSIDCESDLCEANICVVDKESDSDGDGMPDYWEDKYGLNKNDASDADEDADSDGLTNLEEYLRKTDPSVPDISQNPGPSVPLLASGLSLLAAASGFLWYYARYLKPKIPSNSLNKSGVQNSAQTYQQSQQPILQNTQKMMSQTNTRTPNPVQSKKELLLKRFAEKKKNQLNSKK